MAQKNPYEAGGKVKIAYGYLTLAAQTVGAQTFTNGTLSVPEGAIVKSIEISSTVSLGTSTIAIGDGTTADKYKAAATFTTANIPVKAGKAAALFTAVSARESIVLTTAAATLPASGTLNVCVEYVID